MLRGRFGFQIKDRPRIWVPNMIVDEGEEAFLKMLMQGDNTIVAAGGNFYVGLCDDTPVETDTLSDVANEPGATGGYARIAAERNTTGFPTVDQVNGVYRAVSKNLVFSASGANFDTAISRAFLCDAASGTVGTLFALSGPLATTITVQDGASLTVQYELWMD